MVFFGVLEKVRSLVKKKYGKIEQKEEIKREEEGSDGRGMRDTLVSLMVVMIFIITIDKLIFNRFRNKNKTSGIMVNLTDIVGALSKIKGLGLNQYGQNQNVFYITPFYYNKITSITDNMPTFNMVNNDFLLFEFTLDDDWLKEYNLFVFSTYIYKHKGDVIFGTPDSSIFVKPSMRDSNNKIKICCTSSKILESKYSKLGYQISKLPCDYMNNITTFNVLIRFMTTGNSNPRTIDINKYIKTSYNTDNTLDKNDLSNFYDSKEIIANYPTVYDPISNSETINVISNFNKTITYLNSLFTTKYKAYPFFSNFAVPPTNYAKDDAYKSIALPKPLNINANNTGENYFLSNKITIPNTSTNYVYIIYLNQNSSGAGVTSTIQIYDSKSNAIKNGLIQTGPKILKMATPNYPISKKNDLPAYGIYGISMENIYKENPGISSIVVSERISYSLINLYQVNYDCINTMEIYVGKKLTTSQVKTLSDKYYIKVSYPEDST